MIKYFKTEKSRLQEIERIEKDCWINMVEPSSAEIEFISQKLLINSDLIIDPLDADESPRVEQQKNCLLIICRIPLELSEDDALPYKTLPLGIIIKRDLILTVCSKQTEVIQAFVEERVRNLNTALREKMLLQIFLRSSILYLRYLKTINNKADEIQEILHKATRNSELLQLLNLEKSLVYFNTSLKSNELMMMRLQQHTVMKELKESEQELINDVIIETKQAIEMAKIYSNILGNMMGAHSSIISNNLNITIRFLTSITIILSLPILIASLYGMNVELPFADYEHAFWIVMSLALGLSAIGVLFFHKKNLF
ncbi:MAG: magnesium transporter CorA family protein [Bacteroidia bacterium]|nr:magnesium transporter CorA family protein [Bacteroidia bacterium]MCC7532662.1 magnesium transporter CorA family protein [Bacteroidia bacterium]MCZ2141269.1 magnesium transporter CorA family protein [Bacteroidia bacterium]